MWRFFRVTRNVFSEIVADDLTDWSAALAYYFLFALFPLVLVCVAMLGTFHFTALTQSIVSALSRMLPQSAAVMVARQLTKILETRHAGLISLGTVLALYSSSQAFTGLMSAFNAAYEVPETRPYYRRLLLALGLSFTAGLLMFFSLVALLFGHRMLLFVTGKFNISAVAVYLWEVARWSIVIGSLLLAMMLLYRTAPNVKHQNVGFLPAAITALSLWTFASVGLGIYINHFSNYAATYGSLGAVIGLMMWFYVFAFSLLIGAEVHSEVLKQRGIYCKPKWMARQAEAQGVLKKEEPAKVA
jgi:membrane protein